ncbi:potassium channel family protein [Listeria ilorinensis]|uniref:potassium channel family protein n=1 Tax=Listeria ilorinensis TaxID=2867439 RepID=UPI001EF58AB0|nr:potassium channel family protein [Listeria ilorinensis]
MTREKKRLIYEIFMLGLVLLSIALLPYHNVYTTILNWLIWLVFLLDYLVRLKRSDRKWHFVKTHPFELIAAIPFYSGFRAARIVSFFRILQLTAMGKRYVIPLFTFLRTNGLNRFLLIFVLLVIIIPVPMVFLEPSIKDYPDALWWAIVTATTVGYGDIVPVTPLGRILASIMMLFGIGFIGMVTSTLMSYFSAKPKTMQSSEKIAKITKAIEDVPELNNQEIEIIEQFLQMKKQKEIE